jgi:hypothetical protein
MPGAANSGQLVARFRERAINYESQAEEAPTLAGRDVLRKAARSYRRIADLVEGRPDAVAFYEDEALRRERLNM